jgi:hypothetical protein
VSDLLSRIDRAMEHAPQPGVIGDGQIINVQSDGAETISNDPASTVANLEDYDLVDVNPGHTEPLNAVEVQTVAELELLLKAVYARCGIRMSARRISRLVAHEGRHMSVWGRLNVDPEQLVCGVNLSRKGTYSHTPWDVVPYVLAFDVQVPKLGLGAVHLIERPNYGDIAALEQSVGYRPTILRQKLHEHNSAGRVPYIPVPRTSMQLLLQFGQPAA